LIQLKASNITVVLNTGYNSKIANLLLDKLNWKKGIHYDALLTANDVINGRPHPDMIYKAMELMNIKDASTVLKAGDSAIDIEEGKNANCGITIGVLSGAQSRAQIEKVNPTYIIDSLASISEVIDF
jgi:phosphonatase-like hydrolase